MLAIYLIPSSSTIASATCLSFLRTSEPLFFFATALPLKLTEISKQKQMSIDLDLIHIVDSSP